MPYFLEFNIQLTADKYAQVEVDPETDPAAVIDTLQSLKVPTDSSVVPESLQAATAQFTGQKGREIAKIVATMSRPVRVFLKPLAGLCDVSEYIPLCAAHTGGLWPSVFPNGRIEVIEQAAMCSAQDHALNYARFVRLLLDLAKGRTPLPSPEELSRLARAQFEATAAASMANLKLTAARAAQKPPHN